MTLMYERNACPVCSSTDRHTIYKCPYRTSPVLEYMSSTYEGVIPPGFLGNEVYELVLCRNCGLLYQKSVLNEQGMRTLYSDFFCQGPNGEEIIPTRSIALDFVRHIWCMGGILGTPPNETLLVDYGSGWGRWLRVAQGLGYQVAGVEIARPRREYVQKMGILCEEAIEALPSPDAVNCEQVLEHVLYPFKILESITRHLRPGGVVRIGVPDVSDVLKHLPSGDFRGRLNPVAPLEHINGFTSKSLEFLAMQTGLKPVKEHTDDLADCGTMRGALGGYARSLVRRFLYRRRMLFQKPS